MGREGRKEGRKGKRRPFRKNKANQKKQFKPKKKTLQISKSRSKRLKKKLLCIEEGKASRPYTTSSNRAVQCSAVRVIVRTFSANPVAYPERVANPAFLVQKLFLIFPLLSFPLFFFLSFFLSFFPPNFPDFFCFVICYSALFCTCTLCFCFGGGRVKLGTGEEGWGDAWADGSMAQQLAGGLERRRREGKSRRASVLCFFLPFTYLFFLSPFLKVKFYTSVLSEGVLFCFCLFFFTHFSDFLNLTFLARALKLKQCYHSCPHHFSC